MDKVAIAGFLIAVGCCLLSTGRGLVALRRLAVSIRERLIAISQRLIILARRRHRDDALVDWLVDLHADYSPSVNASDPDSVTEPESHRLPYHTVQRNR